MRIQRITRQLRNDFVAIMECEHCGGTQELGSGYHDRHYHEKVIPAMTCVTCGRNQSGEVPAERNDYGTLPVPA